MACSCHFKPLSRLARVLTLFLLAYPLYRKFQIEWQYLSFPQWLPFRSQALCKQPKLLHWTSPHGILAPMFLDDKSQRGQSENYHHREVAHKTELQRKKNEKKKTEIQRTLKWDFSNVSIACDYPPISTRNKRKGKITARAEDRGRARGMCPERVSRVRVSFSCFFVSRWK